MVDQVFQAQTPVATVLKTSEEVKKNILPKPSSSSQLEDSALTQSGQSKMSIGSGRVFWPAHPLITPYQARQTTPGTRPSLRSSGPRMLRPLRPSHPKNTANGGSTRTSQFAPRPGGMSGGYILPNIRSATPIKRCSLSTPQYSSQYNPLVVQLYDFPPRTDQEVNIFSSPNKLCCEQADLIGCVSGHGEGPPHQARLGTPPRSQYHQGSTNRHR